MRHGIPEIPIDPRVLRWARRRRRQQRLQAIVLGLCLVTMAFGIGLLAWGLR